MMVFRKKHDFCKVILIVSVYLLLTLSCKGLYGQKKPDDCLSEAQIVDLLKKVEQKLIIDQINKYGVEFNLGWKNAVALCRKGASDSLLEAIESNPCFPPLQIKFREWSFSGGINVIVSNDKSSIIVKGKTQGYPNCNINRIFVIGKRRTLVVTIENSNNSVFTNEDKMLKVYAGSKQTPLECADKNIISNDLEFIYRSDGKFIYPIPDDLVSDGKLKGLGFVFGPGNIDNLKVSAQFQ